MSLLPHPNRNVKGLAGDEWPQLPVGPLCCAPGCSRFVDHPHHLWRRSALAGPFPWVRLWNGSTVQNVVGICWQHHNRITDDLDRITLEDDGSFLYRDERNVVLGPIKPQPQTIGKDAYPTVSEASVAPGRCPTCNTKIRPSHDDTGEREPSRNRSTWSVTVPKDEREDGAECLDVLLEAARMAMDDRGLTYGPERKVRYYVLAAALGLFVHHVDALVSE
jgi:hypothetical protein